MTDEKTPQEIEKSISKVAHGEELDSGDVYIVNQELAGKDSSEEGFKSAGGLKTTRDGKTVLIPQPSDDPADPLNWSWMKKHMVFASLLPGCFLTDWVITWVSRHCPNKAHLHFLIHLP